jgi:hypothetical protein
MTDTSMSTATCAFPGCDQAVAPPPAVGRPSRYCTNPEHTATAAFYARRRSGQTATGEGGGVDRPASMAGAGFRETVARFAGLLEEARQLTTQAGELLHLATDPEAVSAELAASRAEALRLVAEAQGQLAAEQQARITAEEAAEIALQAQGVAEQRAELA